MQHLVLFSLPGIELIKLLTQSFKIVQIIIKPKSEETRNVKFTMNN